MYLGLVQLVFPWFFTLRTTFCAFCKSDSRFLLITHYTQDLSSVETSEGRTKIFFIHSEVVAYKVK